MSSAFVIHLHAGHGPAHYDLMLQRGDALATWRLERPPAELKAGESMAAKKLPDHRVEYLTYEGPVSKGRGQVKMFDRGQCETAFASDARWEILFHGRAMQGKYELRHIVGDEWELRKLPT